MVPTEIVPEEDLRNYLNTYHDDWDRIHSDCPKFPLRDAHMEDPLIQDGVKTSKMRCYRDVFQNCGAGSRVEESAHCDKHQRREFYVAPSLQPPPMNGARVARRRELGQKIVKYASLVPILGWLLLHCIAMQYDVGNTFIWRVSGRKVRNYGEREIEQATKNLVWSIGLWFVVLVIALAVMLAIELE